jgi:F-box interacting protein
VHTDKIGLYRWDDTQQGATLPLLYATDLSSDESIDAIMAHCDGLVLLPGKATVRVLNPATRRTLTLPHSPGADPPRKGPDVFLPRHQAFGLGHDPRSDKYKVTRLYYRSLLRSSATGDSYDYTIGMEVFTIGTCSLDWRETATRPPYPVSTGQTATFFKGSLLWTIDERILGNVAPGLLGFCLENEAFAVMSMPTPPCYPMKNYIISPVLAELREELWLAREAADMKTVLIWMCDDIENPQWDQRYTINVFNVRYPCFKPIAAFGDEIVLREQHRYTRRYNVVTKTSSDMFSIEDCRYHDPNTGVFGYQNRQFSYFDFIPYIPSLIPV